MPKPTYKELLEGDVNDLVTKPSLEELLEGNIDELAGRPKEGLSLRAPTFDDKTIKQTLDMADVNEVSLDVAERGLDSFVKIKKKKDSVIVGVGPLWDEPGDTRTMRERLNLPPKKTYPLNIGTALYEIPKGVARFLERDIGGTFGGTVYDWIGQLIQEGGYAVDQISKLGAKDKDRIYNPISESIIATGQNISQYGKEARQWYAYHATTGWEAMDEHLRETDPISYGAGRLTEGVASSALAVLSMYLSGGAAAPALLNKGLQINRGLVALSTISAAGGFEHAQNQGENFYWATLHGLADGMTEYAMESAFLEGVGKGTSKLVAGTKEGAEGFFTGMLQNTRAGILENEAKGMPAYDAAKQAVKSALVQSPWEVAAGFIGGYGIAGGSNLVQLVEKSKRVGPLAKGLQKEVGVSEKVAKKAVDIAAKEGVKKADQYLSAVKTVGEEAAEKVIAKPTEAAEVGKKHEIPILEDARPPVVDISEKGRKVQQKIPSDQGRKKTSFVEQSPDEIVAEAKAFLRGPKKSWHKLKTSLLKSALQKYESGDGKISEVRERLAKAKEAAGVLSAKQIQDSEAHIERLKRTYKTPEQIKARIKQIDKELTEAKDKSLPVFEGQYDPLGQLSQEKIALQNLLEAPPAPKAEVGVKEAWEMTREELFEKTKEDIKRAGFHIIDEDIKKNVLFQHKKMAKEAISEGKPVPREVLQEYKSEKWAQEALAKPEALKEKPARDILGGVDPIQQIHTALKAAKQVQPITEAEKKATLKARVGAAIGAMKSNVKKGMPTEEAIFKSSGLLKGPLTEYDQVYSSVEDILEPGAKEAAYQKIYEHPELKYFETLNTATSFKKLLAGSALTPGDVENIERVFGKAFEDITDVRTTRSPLYDRLIAFWKAGLLTGIKTSGLNTLANVSHSISETAKDVPATLVDSVSSLFTGERTLAFTARGVPGGVIEGFERGWKYLRTGLDARHVGAKLDYKKVNFGRSKFSKAVQAYEEAIFHLLGAEDQPFYYGAKARSIYSQAIAQAKNKGLKGAERVKFIENAVAFPSDEMIEYATYDAEVAVFQNRTNLGDLAKAIQKVKGGEVIVPFGRTPSAVAMQIVNYSPIGAVKEISEQIHQGKFDQRKFSQAFGRSVVGTGALYIGAQLFTAGLMTLDYPDNEKERELWKLEGRSANTIKIGDKWRTIQTLGPVGNVLIIGGHFQKALNEEGSPTRAIVTALAGGAKSFSEQTFVRGVNLAVDALSAPERSFENWFSSMAGSAVPTIVGDIARAMDEKGRWATGPKERVQSRIPKWRESLEPSTDVFGQDLPRYGGNVLETMADPTRPSKVRQDVVVDELRRLWEKDIKVSPTKLGDKAGYDILTKEENTRLWRRAGELTYKGLLALINNKGYKDANDFAKGQIIEDVTGKAKDAAKAEMVSIKLAQGKTIMELAESGLFTIESLEMLQYFQKSVEGAKE